MVEDGYRATTVVQGLRVPWEMRFLPDGRLLVTEREGRIVLADVGSGSVTEVGQIDVAAQGEAGLMGLALDPDFPDNPSIYVSYTYSEGEGAQNRVSRFELNGLDTPSPSLGGETVLLDGIPAAPIHDGSRVAFGPDGYLWVTMGDSGNGDLAQQMDSLAGKVLRMTRDGRPAPGNPFLDRPYPFSLIYTLGHRNPQGLAFHPRTGTPYVTEHGPSDNDEINRLEAGGNYGWPDLRGKAGKTGFVDPICHLEPDHRPGRMPLLLGRHPLRPERRAPLCDPQGQRPPRARSGWLAGTLSRSPKSGSSSTKSSAGCGRSPRDRTAPCTSPRATTTAEATRDPLTTG